MPGTCCLENSPALILLVILMSDRHKWRSFLKIKKLNKEIDGFHKLPDLFAAFQLWEMMAKYSPLKLVDEERHPALGSVLESAERYCHRLPDRLATSSRDILKRIGESRSSSTGLLQLQRRNPGTREFAAHATKTQTTFVSHFSSFSQRSSLLIQLLLILECFQ